MATAVTLTAGMADDLEQYPKAKYHIGSANNIIVGMFQALYDLQGAGVYSVYANEVTVTAPDVVNGYVDIVFTHERPTANYFPMVWLVNSSGEYVFSAPDISTRATTGFRANVKEEGTLLWMAIPFKD